MQIIQDFQFSGGNLWKNGKIYDPDSGKTYSAKATLISDGPHREVDAS
jgi:uncharacterized protein (DUF2147 family)